MGRLFAIGDIHGCHGALTALLEKIKPDREIDRVIFLGDYINRGEHSNRVIDSLIEYKKMHPRTVFLKGNHEVMFINYLDDRNKLLFLQSGGRETLYSYGIIPPSVEQARRNIPASHKQFLHDLLPYWEEQDYIFVHAGFKKGRHPSLQNDEWLYWAEKEKFMAQTFPEDHKKIIFGHFAHEKPVITHDKIGIDSGAVYGGALTCLILPDMQFLRVKTENSGCR